MSAPSIMLLQWPSLDAVDFIHASAMLSLSGLLAMLVLRRVPASSWRLRSWLIAAVLLQGLMLARSPLHLGILNPPPVLASPQVLATRSDHLGHASSARSAQAIIDRNVRSFDSDDQRIEGPLGTEIAKMSPGAMLVTIWAIIFAIMVAVGLRGYLQLLAVVQRLEPAPREWQDVWRSLVKRSRRVRDATTCDLLLSKSVGPVLVRRPRGYCLIVPNSFWSSLNRQQRHGVMLHELAHIERRDVWCQLFARFIAALHWFNPFAWWALREYESTAEFACDERVSRDGPQAAAGFASALVELAQWQLHGNPEDPQPKATLIHGVGTQAMAAPPLSARISKLLKPSSTGGSRMKRVLIASLTVVLVMMSFVQLRLTTAQDDPQSNADGELRVLTQATEARLKSLMQGLDTSDPTTVRLQGLFDDAEGKIAIAGMLNTLRSQAKDEAGSEAIPNFVAEHFSRDEQGKLVPLPEADERITRWKMQAQRVEDSIQSVKEATADVAQRLDASTDAGGLFKRFLNDAEGPAAVLLSEMKGGDLVTRYLSEALGRMLVERGDGQFVIVESRRREVEKQVAQFELAEQIRKRMIRELPLLGAEFTNADERHQRLTKYLSDPVTATVVALQLSSEVPNAAKAANQIHEHFESASVDKADGLHIQAEKAWEQLEEIYTRVDRVKEMQDRVQDRLIQISETLTDDDELTTRLAAAMTQDVVAALLAAELPYAENNPGQELRQRLNAVMSEKDGKFVINESQQEEIEKKATELLRVCRQIRRYTSEIQAFLDQVKDQELVDSLGPAGPYLMLDLIRKHAENNRPDVVSIMEQQLLVKDDGKPARVREDRREIVRRLVEQAEQLRAEEVDGDF